MEFKILKFLFGKKEKKQHEQKLLRLYEDGVLFQVDNDVDNKEYIERKMKNGHN